MYDLATQADYAEPPVWAELVTCLERFKTHRCTLELPHDEHRCPCGITWREEVSNG